MERCRVWTLRLEDTGPDDRVHMLTKVGPFRALLVGYKEFVQSVPAHLLMGLPPNPSNRTHAMKFSDAPPPYHHDGCLPRRCILEVRHEGGGEVLAIVCKKG